jgi:hypothetical protein
MGMPRTSVAELKLKGDKKNLKRSLAYPEKKRPSVFEREKMETMFAELTERRVALKSEIEKLGLFVMEERWSNGKVIVLRVANPAVKMLTVVELQLMKLAKLLSGVEEESASTKSALDRELDAIRAEMN